MKYYILSFAILILAATQVWGISPNDAIQKLRAGNERFVAEQPIHPNADKDRLEQTFTDGQKPFAAVLACSDSRSPVELIFDAGVGDLFVIRVAGNIAGYSELASIEYAAEHLKTPVILVLGHTKCGAVSAVVSDAKLEGHLPKLAEKIAPSVEKTKKAHQNENSETIVFASIKENVYQSMADIISQSPVVAKLIKNGDLQLHGAIYDMQNGQIQWLGEHPNKMNLADNSSMIAVDNQDLSFFAIPNLIYMAIFVCIVSLIASILIFILTRKK